MNELLKQYSVLKKEHFGVRIDFAKHFITVASTLLAVLIALKPPSAHSSLLYAGSLVLLLANILFGAAFLYIVLMQYRRLDIDFRAQLSTLAHNPLSQFQGVFSKYNTMQRLCEAGLYLSFVSAMVCLVVFAL